MSYPRAIFLAIVQGLTEFLPISSSGHLAIFQKLFGLEPPVLFDILVHFGTLMAIVFFLRYQLREVIRGVLKRNISYINISYMVVVGTIPAAVVGFFLQNFIEKLFNSLTLVGFSLLLTTGLLFFSRRFRVTKKNFNQMVWKDAFIVGLFQALAILPGVSRSGATIISGLGRGLNRETAFRFSFYLAIPAIIGALALQVPGIIGDQLDYLNQSILGMLVAGITGYLALLIFERVLRQGKLWLFGFYCFVLGMFSVLI